MIQVYKGRDEIDREGGGWMNEGSVVYGREFQLLLGAMNEWSNSTDSTFEQRVVVFVVVPGVHRQLYIAL